MCMCISVKYKLMLYECKRNNTAACDFTSVFFQVTLQPATATRKKGIKRFKKMTLCGIYSVFHHVFSKHMQFSLAIESRIFCCCYFVKMFTFPPQSALRVFLLHFSLTCLVLNSQCTFSPHYTYTFKLFLLTL